MQTNVIYLANGDGSSLKSFKMRSFILQRGESLFCKNSPPNNCLALYHWACFWGALWWQPLKYIFHLFQSLYKSAGELRSCFGVEGPKYLLLGILSQLFVLLTCTSISKLASASWLKNDLIRGIKSGIWIGPSGNPIWSLSKQWTNCPYKDFL